MTCLDADFLFLMKQTPDDFFQRQSRIGKFFGPDRARKHAHMFPIGMVKPDMQTLAPNLTFCKVLHHQAACNAAPVNMINRNADESRQLFGLVDILHRRFAQAVALQRHDPLIAPPALRLWQRPVKGDSQIALTKQREKIGIGRHLGQAGKIKLNIAAHCAIDIIADKQGNRAVLGLRLNGQLAFAILERRTQQRGKHQRFGQGLFDHRRIGVRRQHIVQHSVQPHHTAARVERRYRKAQRTIGKGF